MKLDRNINPDGKGKYALINLRDGVPKYIDGNALIMQIPSCAVDFGDSEDSEFFVIRLKDKYAATALWAYAQAAKVDDSEYANEIMELSNRARNHPKTKLPD